MSGMVSFHRFSEMTKLRQRRICGCRLGGIANNVGIGVSSSAFSGLVRPFVRWQLTLQTRLISSVRQAI
ncbi:hypothetical protein HAX54_050428 [Datura stramonium]|uniref:Uncharacterized protein n=1 Tax=Datura stramonium TaxID=4076 RepID=A0ABS8SXC1_DATST|nr:hypothetical protein [Datura stramonium]